MSGKMRHPRWAVVYFSFATVWAGLTNGWASTYRPVLDALFSSNAKAHDIRPNGSFLADTKRMESFEPNIQTQVMEPHRFLEVRQQLDDLTRSYEMKKKFGIAQLEDERVYQDQVRGMSGQLVDQVKDRQQAIHGNQIVKNVVSRVIQDQAAMTLLQPVIMASAVVGVCTGTPVELPVLDIGRIRSRTDLRTQGGNLEINSNFLTGRFDVAARAPETQNFSKPIGADGERFRFSLFRQLPLVDVSTGLGYASSSRTVSASLFKQVTPEVSLAVGAVQAVDGAPRGEQSVSVNYGLRF